MSETDAERIKREKKIEALRPMSRLDFQILYGKCESSGWVYGEFNETLYQQYIQRYGFFLSHLTLLKKECKIFEDVLLTQLPGKNIFFLVDKSGLIHTISLPGTKAAKVSNEGKAANINWFFAESPNTLDTYVYNPDKNTETAYYTGPLTILKTAALTEVLSASKLTSDELTSASTAAKDLATAAKNAAKDVTKKVKNTREAAKALTAAGAAAKTELTAAAKIALTEALNNVEELTTELTKGLIAAATKSAAAAAAATKSAAATLKAATALAKRAEAAVAAVAASASLAADAEAEVAEALATEFKTETAATVLAALKEAVLLVQTTTQKKNWINQNIILLDFFPFPIIMSTDIRKDVAKEGYTFRMHLSEYFKPLVENVKKIFDEPAPVNVYLIAPPYTSVHAILELTDFEWAELVTLNASSKYKEFSKKPSFGFDQELTPASMYMSFLTIRDKQYKMYNKKFLAEELITPNPPNPQFDLTKENIKALKEKQGKQVTPETQEKQETYKKMCAYLKKRIYLNNGNVPGIPGVGE